MMQMAGLVSLKRLRRLIFIKVVFFGMENNKLPSCTSSTTLISNRGKPSPSIGLQYFKKNNKLAEQQGKDAKAAETSSRSMAKMGHLRPIDRNSLKNYKQKSVQDGKENRVPEGSLMNIDQIWSTKEIPQADRTQKLLQSLQSFHKQVSTQPSTSLNPPSFITIRTIPLQKQLVIKANGLQKE